MTNIKQINPGFYFGFMDISTFVRVEFKAGSKEIRGTLVWRNDRNDVVSYLANGAAQFTCYCSQNNTYDPDL